MSTRDNLTQFLDFRTFLVAHAQEQRRRNPQWTYGAWAKRLGLKGTASLTRVIQGDRHPGPQMVESFVRYFTFSEREAEYFRDLVRLSKLKEDTRLSTLIIEKMGKKFSNGVLKFVDEKSFTVMSNWYYLALREFVRLRHFQADPGWISRNFMFKVNARDVVQALRTLADLGLIVAKPNGGYEVAEGRLNIGGDVANEAVKRHHEEMLENARSALRGVPVEKREITSQTIAVDSRKLPQAKELIRQFQDKFSELMEDLEGGDSIYQLQIQLFPLTREVRAHESPVQDQQQQPDDFASAEEGTPASASGGVH